MYQSSIHNSKITLWGCLCDNWKTSYFPRIIFNGRTFSRRITARWSRGWAKNQMSTNQNSRNSWCQIVRRTICCWQTNTFLLKSACFPTQCAVHFMSLFPSKFKIYLSKFSVYFLSNFSHKNICYKNTILSQTIFPNYCLY